METTTSENSCVIALPTNRRRSPFSFNFPFSVHNLREINERKDRLNLTSSGIHSQIPAEFHASDENAGSTSEDVPFPFAMGIQKGHSTNCPHVKNQGDGGLYQEMLEFKCPPIEVPLYGFSNLPHNQGLLSNIFRVPASRWWTEIISYQKIHSHINCVSVRTRRVSMLNNRN